MIQEFHACKARLRALIGGRGTGKTTAIAVEASGHCLHNAGAKVYILRKTQDSNENTTLETFERQVFTNLGTAYRDTGASLFKRINGGQMFRMPSRKAVEAFNEWKHKNPGASKSQINAWIDAVGHLLCSWIEFAGVPEERYAGTRFRGYECSMLIFVEADQLSSTDLDLGMACLRWKGTDPETCDEKGFIRDTGAILDTNPPSPRHWIAQLERDSADSPRVRFWHLPTRGNQQNLPEGYTDDLEHQYRNKPAMYKRMVSGEYAEAFDGTPVFHEFTEKHACAGLPWPRGAYLIRSWDFGSTNSVIFSAYWEIAGCEYWWDLHEIYAMQSDVDRQCQSVVDVTAGAFPFWNNRLICSGVKDYCDPAGNAKTDKGSSVNVLRTYGFFPGFQRAGLQESIAVVNRLFQKKDKYNNPVYRIDKLCCPMLYTANLGGYRYPVAGEPGFGGDEPLKGASGGNYDHVADASRYGKFNALHLIRKEMEEAKKNVGALEAKNAENRIKRYY